MSALSNLTGLFNSGSAVFKTFSEHYDLVYFGHIRGQDDEQRIVRGITASSQHTDEHYCVGTVHGYDIILLKRTDSLTLPNTVHKEKYSWVIMQFDLHSRYDFPHALIDGGHHNEIFYQTLFVKFSRFMKIDKAVFGDEGEAFANTFTAYSPPDAIDNLPEIMAGDVGLTLSQHFTQFDFEWFQDRLIVYSTGRTPSKHLLEHMLRAGLWFAEVLDKYGQQKISVHGGETDIPRVVPDQA